MIAALVLAAGESRRMGQPKMALPWGETSVLGHVIRVLKSAGIENIVVVTGGGREVVEDICRQEGVTPVFNEAFERDEMLGSLQVGLKGLPSGARAALVALGDQPQILESSARMVVQTYLDSRAPLVVPSYNMRRGHPWLVSRAFWKEILEMKVPETPRDFLSRHSLDILYVDVDSPTILQDLDTPEGYLKSKP